MTYQEFLEAKILRTVNKRMYARYSSTLWSASSIDTRTRGELVYDPFGGLMTVPYCAIKLGRRGYGCELSEDYFRFGVEYCRDAENERLTPTLFDCLEVVA